MSPSSWSLGMRCALLGKGSCRGVAQVILEVRETEKERDEVKAGQLGKLLPRTSLCSVPPQSPAARPGWTISCLSMPPCVCLSRPFPCSSPCPSPVPPWLVRQHCTVHSCLALSSGASPCPRPEVASLCPLLRENQDEPSPRSGCCGTPESCTPSGLLGPCCPVPASPRRGS